MKAGGAGGGDEPVRASARSNTRTCCCRSRRSPRPPARSSTPKARCRASTAWCSRWARRGPAWKVLRVLGNLLGLAGFDYDSAEEVRREALRRGAMSRASSTIGLRRGRPLRSRRGAPAGSQRIGEVPIYAADAIVRRSPLAAENPRRRAAGRMDEPRARTSGWACATGDALRVRQGGGEARRRGRRRRRAARRLHPARGRAARDRGARRDVRRGDRRARAGAAEGRPSRCEILLAYLEAAASVRRGRRCGRSPRSSRSSLPLHARAWPT